VTSPESVEGLLGLFPSFAGSGGIQLSGQLAWEGINNRHNRNGAIWHPYLFTYGSPATQLESPSEKEIVSATSKSGALISAMRTRWPVKVMLVWHLALLKLLPFFKNSEAKIALFLHGIEAWKHHDWLTRRLLRRVDLFLTNSDYTWEKFIAENPEHRSKPHITVHLGLSSAADSPTTIPQSVPAALMIGRLNASENYKGHNEMIAAWTKVIEVVPNAQLWIVGDGDLKSKLEGVVSRAGLDGKIIFWGWVSESEKLELIRKSNFLALPSRGEGFGLVYLEAMKEGRPCLVSTFDAAREVVNPPEAGLAIDTTQVDALVDAVERLLKTGPEWEVWSRRARDRYESQFTASHFQNRLIAALSSLR